MDGGIHIVSAMVVMTNMSLYYFSELVGEEEEKAGETEQKT